MGIAIAAFSAAFVAQKKEALARASGPGLHGVL